MIISRIYSLLLRISYLKTRQNSLILAVRKHIILPALFNDKHRVPQKLFNIPVNAFPSRWMSLLVIMFGILNVILLFPNIDVFTTSTSDSISTQWARYIADRSGIFATVLFPSLITFGGRNNLLSLLFGWSEATCNVVHRWIGRWTFIQMSIHGLAYSVQYLADGRESYVNRIWHKKDVVWGSVATILAGVIIAQGFYALRRRFYEIFLILHIALSAVCVAYSFKHVRSYDKYPYYYWKYMWAAIGCWAGEHALRIFRIISFGPFIKAEAKSVSGASQITIKPTIKWNFKPGQHVYLYVFRFNIWESHPFTVMPGRDGSYALMLKPEQGMTKKLHNRLKSRLEGKTTFNVWVEGMYGESHPVHRFDTLVLLAGGVGITCIAAYALDAIKNSKRQHVILHWVVREESWTNWIKDQLEDIISSNAVEVHLYVTGERPLSESDSDGKESTSENGGSISLNLDKEGKMPYEVSYGRPVIGSLLENNIAEATGSVAVVVCGPAAMCDSARKAVAENVEKDSGYVEYFEDSY
ncbi:ferric reductase NAD binding domain-containing protein [Dipodascopsis uninucleata]